MENSAEERLLLPSEATNVDLKNRVWEESKKIWRVATPAIVFGISWFGTFVITQLYLGHVSATVLAAFALGESIFLRFVNGIMLGMSSATETLCGQAFGAKQYHMLGIYMQRSWIVNFTTLTIFVPLFIFTKQILIAIGQDKSIAEEAGTVSLWFIPYIYNFVFMLSIQQFLQAQMRNRIVGFIAAPVFVCHVILSGVLVLKLGLGLTGAMISLILAGWAVVCGEFVYVFGGWCPDTWTGFTKAAFVDLWPVVKLSASSGVMLCLEVWYNSILVLMAGYMQDAAVAIDAFYIWYPFRSININVWQFMVCLGFLVAASVRVSNELGRGNAKAAKFAMKVIISTSAILGVFCFAVFSIFRKQIAYLFTSNDEVAEAVSNLSLSLSFNLLLNSIQSVLNGIAIGSGLQSLIAYVNLGSYFLIGVPIGACLGYLTDLQVMGLWIGLLCGVVLQVLFVAYIVVTRDWDAQVEQASSRLKGWYIKPDESGDGIIGNSDTP